jgi:hypothetical protein
MMEPNREPGARDLMSDEAIVAFLRTHAPGLPAVRFDGPAVAARARRVQRRRRRLGASAVTFASAALVYLLLALVGPLPVPGGGNVSLPGSRGLRAAVAHIMPGPPKADQWGEDVNRLERDVLPVVEELRVFYYLYEEGTPCRVLEYGRGNFREGSPACGPDQVPFDAQGRADFERVRLGVEHCGVQVQRIYRSGGVRVQVVDSSGEYNWEYAYLPGTDVAPPKVWPEEEWTHIRDQWWFHRGHDD